MWIDWQDRPEEVEKCSRECIPPELAFRGMVTISHPRLSDLRIILASALLFYIVGAFTGHHGVNLHNA
jgi:hypothetical protein